VELPFITTFTCVEEPKYLTYFALEKCNAVTSIFGLFVLNNHCGLIQSAVDMIASIKAYINVGHLFVTSWNGDHFDDHFPEEMFI
jgi:hypothetical protein